MKLHSQELFLGLFTQAVARAGHQPDIFLSRGVHSEFSPSKPHQSGFRDRESYFRGQFRDNKKLNPNVIHNRIKTRFCHMCHTVCSFCGSLFLSLSLSLSVSPRLLQTLQQCGLQYLSLVTSNVLHTNWVFF